jgi:hypothetical protein
VDVPSHIDRGLPRDRPSIEGDELLWDLCPKQA